MNTFFERTLNFIYPRKCVLCGEIGEHDNFICPVCEHSLTVFEPPHCAKCGRSMGEETGTVCGECAKADFAFDRCAALWPYSGKQARTVLDLKFNRKIENGKILGILCAEDIMKKQLSADINIVIPVPLHKSKMRQRGYNQAGIIAKEIGRRLGISVDASALKRIKKTVPQMDLNPEQRMVNMNGSMSVKSDRVAGKNILLIDDIFTTGSTLSECAKTLKSGGAKTVNCYCVCVPECSVRRPPEAVYR